MFADWPFVAKIQEFKIAGKFEEILTGYVRARSKLGCHLRIHSDVHLLFVRHEHVSILNLVDDPILESVADNSRHDVDKPLLWHLLQVGLIRQVVDDARLVQCEVKDLLHGQVLILRDVHSFHVVDRDVCLSPSQDVLQEVDGHVVCKIYGYSDGEG